MPKNKTSEKKKKKRKEKDASEPQEEVVDDTEIKEKRNERPIVPPEPTPGAFCDLRVQSMCVRVCVVCV